MEMSERLYSGVHIMSVSRFSGPRSIESEGGVGDCGVVLRSMQEKPVLGAIDAGQLKAALADDALRTDTVMGTACRCHGVITALKKKSVPG